MQHLVDAAGDHVLKFWLVDSGVVLQKLVLEARPVNASYLGPPEHGFTPAEREPVSPLSQPVR